MKKIKTILLSIAIGSLSILSSVMAQPVQQKAPFDESVWRVEHLNQQKKLIKFYQKDSKFTYLSFNPYTHKISGSGLCNKFLASFESNDNQMHIKDMKQQANTCSDEQVNEQDKRFFTYLKSVKFFSLHGKILRLLDENNQILITAKFFK